MVRFLINKDYSTYAQADILNDITRGDLTRLQSAELSAQAEIEGYLNIRYDVQAIFIQIRQWENAQDYKEDDVVVDDNTFYTAKRDNQAKPPNANIDDWEKGDPRAAIVVRAMVVISLYQAYQALHGYQIPEHRVQEYDLIRKWLKMAAMGEIDPLLPKPAVTDTSKAIVSGGGLIRKDYQF